MSTVVYRVSGGLDIDFDCDTLYLRPVVILDEGLFLTFFFLKPREESDCNLRSAHLLFGCVHGNALVGKRLSRHSQSVKEDCTVKYLFHALFI